MRKCAAPRSRKTRPSAISGWREREKIKRPEMKVYSITLENVNKPELQLVKNEKAEKKAAAAEAKPGGQGKEGRRQERLGGHFRGRCRCR